MPDSSMLILTVIGLNMILGLTYDRRSHIFMTIGHLSVFKIFLRVSTMELIALTTFLTFANITGVVAATQWLDDYPAEREGIVVVEEVARNSEPGSLLEVLQSKMDKSR